MRMAAAALSVAVGVAAAPANASESVFTWLGCDGRPVVTTGGLIGYDAGAFYDGAWRGEVFGFIFACRAPVETDVFAIASYDSDGTAIALATRYPDLNIFSAEVDVRPKTVAVCLIDNLKSRLDCIKVSWLEQEGGPARPVNSGQLPVDSPQVAAAPVVTMDGMVIEPGCPTCVEG
jgi:hypothetical protein